MKFKNSEKSLLLDNPSLFCYKEKGQIAVSNHLPMSIFFIRMRSCAFVWLVRSLTSIWEAYKWGVSEKQVTTYGALGN
jgi:hypothetical protein